MNGKNLHFTVYSCSQCSTPFHPLLQFTQEWQVNFGESNTNHWPHNCNHRIQLYVTLFTYTVSLCIVISGKWIERAKLHPAQAEFIGSVVVKPTDISTNLRKNKIVFVIVTEAQKWETTEICNKNNFWKEIPVSEYFIRMLYNDTNFSVTEVVLFPRALSSLWKICLYFSNSQILHPNLQTQKYMKGPNHRTHNTKRLALDGIH